MDFEVSGKTYWLVGASAGIGAALARELDRRGAKLILSARSKDGLAEVANSLSMPARIMPLDVTDADAVAETVASLHDIDGVIYMAGDYEPMKATDWDRDRAVRISEVNFIGALRVLGGIVSAFVRRDHGHVVIIGSVAGFTGLPGAVSYGASKAALMHLAQNMRTDLKETGVRVQLVNPGFVKTRLTQKNDFRMPLITSPEDAAERIAHHMERSRFSTSFPWLLVLYFKLAAIGGIFRF